MENRLEDSKPFQILHDDSQKFLARFDTDVKQLTTHLELSIVSLIRNADNSNSRFGGTKTVNSHQEFSKAKYEIFMSLTSKIKEMEHSWVDTIAEMRSSFLESVEVFLAGTKLERKATASSPKQKGSSINQSVKQLSPKITVSSLYPKLHTSAIAKAASFQKIDEISESDDSSIEDLFQKHGIDVEDDDDEEEEEVPQLTPLRAVGRKGKQYTSLAIDEASSIGRRTRTLNKLTNPVEEKASPKTPKSVQFSVDLDVNEDLEIYSPEPTLMKSTPRRKTVFVPILQAVDVTPEVAKSRGKRKTIGGGDLTDIVAASPKRLKRGRSSVAPATLEEEAVEGNVSNLSESDEANYTPWIVLTSIDGKVPTQPGIYELKSAQAKRAAYIGGCESLRKQLTLHKMLEKSGHKHLDKFIERNINHVQVRYEPLSPSTNVKNEAKLRVQNFAAQFKSTPAYN